MASRPPTRATLAEATSALQRLLVAVERGEIGTTEPKEVALIRRLQGVLAGWEMALGQQPAPLDHPE